MDKRWKVSIKLLPVGEEKEITVKAKSKESANELARLGLGINYSRQSRPDVTDIEIPSIEEITN